MRAYMRDGRIPAGWRIDIPNRCIERWSPAQPDEPIAISRGQETVAFEDVSFAVKDVFAGLVWTTNQ